jgi:hypothetical protein
MSLKEASAVTGYSSGHLGRLIRDGKVHNLGTKKRPKVRYADLPRKPRAHPAPQTAHALGVSARALATAIAQKPRGLSNDEA